MAAIEPNPGGDVGRRGEVTERAERLAAFLNRWGMYGGAEFAPGLGGGWLLQRTEGAREEVFEPDIGPYLTQVPGILTHGYQTVTLPGTWRATGRRSWVKVGWDADDGEWFYEYPGPDDDDDDEGDDAEREAVSRLNEYLARERERVRGG